MHRRMLLALVCAAAAWGLLPSREASAEQAFGRAWGNAYSTTDWGRFYHYPYVWYPQNFYGPDYYKSSESLDYRYPPEMRIPVYNKKWHNEYPEARKYHRGHHFILDTF